MEYVNPLLLLLVIAGVCSGIALWLEPRLAEWIGAELLAHAAGVRAGRKARATAVDLSRAALRARISQAPEEEDQSKSEECQAVRKSHPEIVAVHLTMETPHGCFE
jgi:hypothetical protein